MLQENVNMGGGALAMGRQALFPAVPSDRRGGHPRPTAERFGFWAFGISEGPKVGASPECPWETVENSCKSILTRSETL